METALAQIQHKTGDEWQALGTRWAGATVRGWTLGFVLVLVSIAVADLVRLGGQAAIGFGMGLGVGISQGRLLSAHGLNGRAWGIASAAGLSAPFIVHDVSAWLDVVVPYSLPTYIVLGGLLVGVLQWPVLRPHTLGAAWWVLGSAAGWAAGGSVVVLNDRLLPRVPGLFGALLYVVVLLLGGLLLGLIGRAILRRFGLRTGIAV